MKYTALVPVKSLAEAKSRLAGHLTQTQRATLMLEMLHHVLCVLHKSRAFAQISVVSSDRYVLERSQAWGAYARVEELAGHNPALTAAAGRERAEGSSGLLTISADLPLLQTHDIQAIIEQARHYSVVLAASQEETGTNAFFARPPLVLPYVFGPGSLQHYLAEAEQQQVSCYVQRSLGLALDIDTMNDLELFYSYNTTTMAP